MAPLLECHEASKHHLLEFAFFLLDRQTLVCYLGKDLLLCSSYLPLGVPNWVVILPASSYFFGAMAGEKEDFCKESFARTFFTLF
jgi:hypothetical protein